MLIEPLLPPWPEKAPGLRPAADRLCLQGILYMLHNDIAWQLLVLAKERDDRVTEQGLVTEWRERIRQLLVANPDAATELERVLNEAHPELPAVEGLLNGAVRLSARATGHGRVYRAGRDQHITER